MNTKKLKNYLLLIVILIVSIILVVYFALYFERRQEYEKSINTRMKFLSQLKLNEIESYIMENHDTMIYISNSADDQYSTFEHQLKKMIVAKEYTKALIYVDVNQMNGNLIEELKSSIDPSLSLSELSIPNVLAVSDGKVSDVLYRDNSKKSPKDIIYFIEEHMEVE